MYFYHTLFTSKGGLVLLTEFTELNDQTWIVICVWVCTPSRVLALNSDGDDMNAGLLWYRWKATFRACYVLRYKNETALKRRKTSGAYLNNDNKQVRFLSLKEL